MSMKNQIQENLAEFKKKWNEIEPSKRRIIMASSAITFIVVLVLYLGAKKEEARKVEAQSSVQVKDELQTEKIVPPKVGEVGLDGLAGLTQNELDRQKAEQQALMQNQEKIANEYRTGNEAVGQTVSDLYAQVAAVSDQVKQMGTQSNGMNGTNLPPLQGLDGNSNLYSQPQTEINSTEVIIQDTPVESTVPRQVEAPQDPFNIIRSGKDVSKYQSSAYRDSTSLKSTNTKALSVQAKLFLQHGLPSGSMM